MFERSEKLIKRGMLFGGHEYISLNMNQLNPLINLLEVSNSPSLVDQMIDFLQQSNQDPGKKYSTIMGFIYYGSVVWRAIEQNKNKKFASIVDFVSAHDEVDEIEET